MRILTAELRKTLTLRFFSVLLIAVVANFFLFRHNLTNSYSFYEQKAYIAAQQDVMAIPEDQRLSYLQEKAQLLDACTQWETETDPVISEDMRSHWDIYTSGAYLQYTEDLFSERFLFRDLLQEAQQTANHTQTIKSINSIVLKNRCKARLGQKLPFPFLRSLTASPIAINWR